MKQYCRYCANANVAEEDLFYCSCNKQTYNSAKSKRVNLCKNFDFCENDLWRCDEFGNFSTYKPRTIILPKGNKAIQYSLFEQINESQG